MKDLLKSKLAWIVAILIILNILSLGALWCSHSQHHMRCGGHGDSMSMHLKHHGAGRHGGDKGRHFMTEKLNLTPEQQVQFDTLRNQHFAEVSKNMEQIRALKKQLMALIEASSPSDSAAQHIASQIGTLESAIELERYRHFQKMYQICNDEQKAELKKTLDHLMTRDKHHGPRRVDQGPQGGPSSCTDRQSSCGNLAYCEAGMMGMPEDEE